ncbi:MAG: hypothetical protein WDN24_09910 [Sphingomonas sp.]
MLRDAGAMDPARLIRQPGRFDCTTEQYRFGPGDFWVISGDIGQRAQPQLNVRIASVWMGGLTLHILYDDGRIATLSTDARGVTPFIQLGAVVELPLPPAQAKVVRLLWHVKGAANVRGVVLGARLATEPESVEANLTMGAIYAAFGGLALALIVYNLALWGALRHRFQLWYCAMTAGCSAMPSARRARSPGHGPRSPTTIGCGSTICCSG